MSLFFSYPSRSYSSYNLEQSKLNRETTIETRERRIKKETVFFPKSPSPESPYFIKTDLYLESLDNLLRTPEKIKEESSSDTRSAFREPTGEITVIKSERDSFESDCAVGSHKATNETQISSEILTENIFQLSDHIISHKDINFVSVKTEEPQEDKLFPCSGNCFGDSQPDQDMADPFYEEFVDFNNLFPDLIPGVDEDECHLLPGLSAELLPKDEPTATVIKEVMADLDSILAETEVTDDHEEEFLEVVDEAAPTPVTQDPTEVLSPGSVVSLESCDTSNYTSTYAESISSDNIDVDLLQILEFLEKEPTEPSTSDAGNLNPEVSTVDTSEIFTQVVTGVKHKSSATEEPAAKKAKPHQDVSNTTTGNDKATQRRLKNNAASKVCRATRRKREEDLFQKEKELTESNAALRAQVEELTKETQTLRNILVQRLSGNNN